MLLNLFIHSFRPILNEKNCTTVKGKGKSGKQSLQLTLVKSSAIQVHRPLAQAPIWAYCAEEEWIASQKATSFSRREQCLMKGLRWIAHIHTFSSVIGTVTVMSTLTLHSLCSMNEHFLNPLTSLDHARSVHQDGPSKLSSFLYGFVCLAFSLSPSSHWSHFTELVGREKVFHT